MAVIVPTHKTKDGKVVRGTQFKGDYIDAQGKRRVVNLQVPIVGVKGSKEYENALKKARERLLEIQVEMRLAKSNVVVAQNLYQGAVGETLAECDLDKLIATHRISFDNTPSSKRTKKYLNDFLVWCVKQGYPFITHINQAIAERYLHEVYDGGYTFETLKSIKFALQQSLDILLPPTFPNPFKRIKKFSKWRKEGDEEIHKEALTLDQAKRLLQVCKQNNLLLYDMVCFGLATSFRKEDICLLLKKSVHLNEGIIRAKLKKTKVEVVIPIASSLVPMLTRRLSEEPHSPYIFPQAAFFYTINPKHLDDMLKNAILAAFDNEENAPSDKPTHALESVLNEVLERVEASSFAQSKKEKIVALLPLYAQGLSFREIEAKTNIPRGRISDFLHSAESICPYRWLRYEAPKENKKIRIKRIVNRRRSHGKVSASIMGWHALRVSFVSWAFGDIDSPTRMSAQEIMKFTGHTSTRALERSYNRTKGVSFRKSYESSLGGAFSAIMG